MECGRPLDGPGDAFGNHFGGLWVILAAFGAQTAPKTPSSLHFGGLGSKRDAKRHPNLGNNDNKSVNKSSENLVGFLVGFGSVLARFLECVFGGLDLHK